MKVLLADDDRVTTTMLSATMIKRGWQVLVAHDAMQALMYAGKAPMPDVIVIDINMPGGTGYHAIERLSASTRTASIPVIVITGSIEPTAAARAERLGVAGFMKKPIDPNALADAIAKLANPGSPPPSPTVHTQ